MNTNMSLKKIFQEHKGKLSDKWSLYLDEWDRLFEIYRDQQINLLEIGIQNGGSLEVWSEYFQKARKIIGCDIDKKCEVLKYDDDRIAVIVDDANSDDCERKIIQLAQVFEIIIDDASHRSSDIVRLFARYFPHLNDGGIYIVEDLHCSYWESYEGGLNNPFSAMAFFKRLSDLVNYEHWKNDKPRRSLLKEFAAKFNVEFDELDLSRIHSIEIINSLCIIKKLPPEKNVLGKRVVVGEDEFVTTGWEKLKGAAVQENAPEIVDDGDLDIFELYNQIQDLILQASEKEQLVQALTAQVSKSEQDMQALAVQVAEKEHALQMLSVQAAEREQQLTMLAGQYNEIASSKTWRAALLARRLRVRLLPPGSLRLRLARNMRSILLSPFSLWKNYQRNQEARLVRASGLFDLDWYLDHNPDVTQPGVDPLLHFVRFGGQEGRDPGPNFSSRGYLESNEDVKSAGINPLVHYLKYGRQEGRQPLGQVAGKKQPVQALTVQSTQDAKTFTQTQNPGFERKIEPLFPLVRIVDRKKISVIITSYNHARYINQCAESILEQKGNFNLEIILGDDCSTDNTNELLQVYSELYPGIVKIFPKRENMGVTKNLKRCLEACTGEYIAICEGDDYWTDEYKLQKQMQLLEEHKDYSMCFSAYMIFYEDENKFSPFSDQTSLGKDVITTEDLILINSIGNFSCCMYRTDAVKKLPKDIYDVFTVDWMFNMACGEVGKIGFIKDTMSVYRKHSKGVWTGKSDAEQIEFALTLVDIYDRLLDHKYHGLFIIKKERLIKSASYIKDLLVLDTIFPQHLSPFRYQEFISYLDHFPNSLVLTTGEHFSSVNERRSLADVILEFEKEHPEYKRRTIITSHNIEPYSAKLAYVVFLYNMKLFLETLEKNRVPFIFTLYPGASFELNKRESDDVLERIFKSRQFRKVIVTQKITYDYLVNKKLCDPSQIEFIFGVVTPLDLIKPYVGKQFFGFDKDTLDICFVAHKYMPKGIDKGYDIFLEVARILTKIHNNINFHVVGSFDETDIPINGLEGRIFFYGLQRKEWFDSFYMNKDIILSPNAPFKIVGVDGAFDGFPTASCTEAGLRKVAVFCTDELHLNVRFIDEEDLVIIPHDSKRIARIIESYYSNPAKLKQLAETGSVRFSNTYNYENQILPRIKIIEAELGK